MLDKLITYIVCWYKTLYQVLPVAWTNRITTRRLLIWYWFTQQARPDTKACMYVMGIYQMMEWDNIGVKVQDELRVTKSMNMLI